MKVGDKIKICDNEFAKFGGKVEFASNCIGMIGEIIGIRKKKDLKEPVRDLKNGLNNPKWIKWEKRKMENKFCFKIKLENGNICYFSKKEIFKSRFI